MAEIYGLKFGWISYFSLAYYKRSDWETKSIVQLKLVVEDTPSNDNVFVVEFTQWYDNIKRICIFTSATKIEHIPRFDKHAYEYWKNDRGRVICWKHALHTKVYFG